MTVKMAETTPQEFKTVCGGSIKDTSKYPSAEYHGQQIYFCTEPCLRTFKLVPDHFMAGEIEHLIDEE
jgi:YHS domain-containing protein